MPPEPTPTMPPEPTPTSPPQPTPTSPPEPTPTSPPTGTPSFLWPTYGPITTYFGECSAMCPHAGIDIDLFAYQDTHTPIAASAAGSVTLASWYGGYGYTVIIDHGSGWTTLYGHLSQLWVSAGQYVGALESVGLSGSTGNSTGEHLHFEIHYYGVPVDPLKYLP
jgi:murein DD-endopeptidase MepM/ murein hydrolase activator NlpD